MFFTQCARLFHSADIVVVSLTILSWPGFAISPKWASTRRKQDYDEEIGGKVYGGRPLLYVTCHVECRCLSWEDNESSSSYL